MALASGSGLGPYELVEPIGEGGMGQVYRARDTKLGRDVALKVLHESVTADPDRLARFQREAELLASLNHPNIAQIYGLEDSGDTTALVLELIEGPTLAERIAQGAIPLDEATPIASQIATALEAAHEQGIIHRDLKPANIKLTPDGTVKVLDFGLAKALDESPGTDPSESPTVATAVTGTGVIMGTAAYMSPEQARGKPVDRRAEDVSLTLAEVMKSEPNWDALRTGVSPTLQLYLRRCFEKNPTDRVRDMGDVRLALSGMLDTEPEPVPVTAPVANRAGSEWIAATAVVMAVAAIAAWQLRPPVAKPVVRFHHDLAEGQGFAPGAVFDLSPDGRWLVFNTGRQLFVRSMDETTARPIAGTEGEGIWNPVFSPDGEWIAYYIPPTGAKHKISSDGGVFPMWSPSGPQLFYRNNSSSRNLTLRSVDITLAPNFGFTYERTLLLERFIVVAYQRDYDISPDGQKLLMVYPADRSESSSAPAPRIQIVLNWVEELKTRVPVN